MSLYWKSLGVAVTSMTCWMAARGLADEFPQPPVRPTQSATAPQQPRTESETPRLEEPTPPRAKVAEEPAESPPKVSKTRTTLRGIANGLGNTIIIENTKGKSTTVLENSRFGVGNRVIIVDGEIVPELTMPELPRNKERKFGEMKFFSPMHQATLYWNPKTLSWYRYDRDRAEYVPAEWMD